MVMMPITPGLIDVILVGMALECIGLVVYLRRRGSSHLAPPLVLHLASGGALMVALRIAIAEVAAPAIALALLASLVVHVGSLWQLHRVISTSCAGALRDYDSTRFPAEPEVSRGRTS